MPAKKSKPKSARKAKSKTKLKTKKKARPKIKEKVLGKIEHVFDKIHVVTTTLKNPMKVGDIIHIKGHTTDFVQSVDSLQIEHETVQKAKKGDGIGLKVINVVRDTDIIYLAGKKTALLFKGSLQPARETQLVNMPKPAGQPAIPQARQQTSFSFNPIIPQAQKPQNTEQPGKKEPPKFISF